MCFRFRQPWYEYLILGTGGTSRCRWSRPLWPALACCLLAALFVAPGTAVADPAFDAHGSVEQVYATSLAPGAAVALLDSGGQAVATRTANDLGGTLFRNVAPGSGYKVASGGEESPSLQVLDAQSAPPSSDLYDQTIEESGYQYLTTRDGTKLAIDVHPPQDVTHALPGVTLPPIPAGPTPTLIEYSGYGYANPDGPENGIAIIANLMGFTVVDVNMRGTGCSGGAYDFFEPLQNLDGYDVVETIANQPWVLHNKVGMMGISYGGISQLFTAATRPPSLAAISPLSVIDNTQTTLYPGGILNTGFALEWAKERVQNAEAADPDSGQHWAQEQIEAGDEVCKANQALHPEAANLLQKIEENSHYKPEVADPLSPVTFVDKIDVPTFMACQWTDEQTGGHCPTLAEHMTGTDRKWFTFTNGTHIDSLDPETFNRWFDFLQLYVAERPPILAAPAVQAAAPVLFKEAMGIEGVTLPPDPIQAQPTYDTALAAFEAQKPIRVLFDSGAGKDPLGQSSPGKPYPGFEQSFDGFPVPGTEAKRWYLAPGGALTDSAPAAGADEFTWDAGALPKTDFSGNTGSAAGGLWTQTPDYHWEQSPPRSAVSYLTDPLAADTTVIGAGAVEAWVRSSTPNVDLQATISEVRPDGKETFVQNGWVRADERKLDAAKSTPLEPVLSLREADVEPMPADQFVAVTIPLYYEGHAYRAGSRVRVTIAAPNGTQPIWAFDETDPEGTAQVAIAYGGETPSSLLLPVIPGVSVPTGLPPCPGLRGEPCRDYQELANLAAVPAGTSGPSTGSPSSSDTPNGTAGIAAGGSTTTQAPPAAKRLKCRKGFKKKKVKGRTVCRKVKKHHHRRRN
ncbi:MAG TPA: CocE/NonD family hydrolase [Solirubrobacterales bacterium]|nr:CocE/NonD family hydrolase [Solirubrobacterales bacterium]